MASKIKVDTLETANGSGSITLNNPIAGFTSTGIDDNATSTAITIDASENVLVGQTSLNTANNGHSFGANGNYAHHTSTESTTLILNRKTSDGDILRLRKDNAEVGSINTGTSRIGLRSGDTGIMCAADLDAIYPQNDLAGRDAAIDLGVSGARFKDLYLSGGIKLGGTGAANTLDDYEEGTATISYTPASGSITMFYNTARYVKIGQLVFMEFSLSCNGSSSPSGTVKLTGLPFTANATGGLGVAGTGGAFGGYQFPTDQTNVYVYNGSTEAYVYDDGGNYLQASEIGTGYNAGQGGFSFTYRTNS